MCSMRNVLLMFAAKLRDFNNSKAQGSQQISDAEIQSLEDLVSGKTRTTPELLEVLWRLMQWPSGEPFCRFFYVAVIAFYLLPVFPSCAIVCFFQDVCSQKTSALAGFCLRPNCFASVVLVVACSNTVKSQHGVCTVLPRHAKLNRQLAV
jgi:hypothetical protein